MNNKLKKSLKLNENDVLVLEEIVERDVRITTPAEAFTVAFEDAAAFSPNWKDVIEQSKTLQFEKHTPELAINSVKSFIVNTEDYIRVVDSVNDQLDTKRPRSSFVTRMAITALLIKLRNRSEFKENIKNRISIEQFASMSIDEKLNAMYKILLKL